MSRKTSLSASVLCLLTLLSCKGSKGVPGLDRFDLRVLGDDLLLSFVATSLSWDAGIRLSVPGVKNAELEISPDAASNGTLFRFTVSLQSIVNDGKIFPLSRLPGGQAIPDVSGGVLPRWDVKISSSFLLSMYLSNEAFGAFFPIPFISGNVLLRQTVTKDIVDAKGNRIGRVYAIPPNVSGKNGGLLVLLPFLSGSPQE